MSLYDTFMSDTAGVVFRAATGNVDPWTKQELIDQAAADQVKAGADPATAAAQAQQDVTDTLSTFSLGGDDRVGADPSQAKLALPSGQALSDTFKSLTNDNGTGCGITNLAGCLPEVPTWAKFAAAGIIVVGVLWLLRPYIGLANSVRGG
jgi:hypothetical protein